MEAAWPSALGCWCCKLGRGPGLGFHPVTSRICFSIVPNSNLQSCFENSKLVCLLPIEIFNYIIC